MAQFTDWQSLHATAFAGLRVCITGGAGFIGSHLVEALTTLGAKCVVIDDLSGGDRANIEPFNAEFIEASILDRAALAKAVANCRYVFHQAALGSVPRSVELPALYNEVNTTGTLNVLEAARAAAVERVMFAASSSAYGNSEVLPKVETMAPLPMSPYAATKLAGEGLLRAYAASYGLDTVSLRYFNIFGPRQNANSAYAAVIAAFAKALLSDQHPVIFGDGEQSRDFTFVHNAVHANLLAARSARKLAGEVINVAIGQRITVNQLASEMARLLNKPHLTPLYKDIRAGDVKHSLADLSLAQELLGYQPIVDFQTGLADTVKWYAETMSP
jgi:nucleoside-diphosphate-sugar epimerase